MNVGKRFDADVDERLRRADLVHVVRKAAHADDVHADAGRAALEQVCEDLNDVEYRAVGRLFAGNEGSPRNDRDADQKKKADHEQSPWRVVALDDEIRR